MAENTQESESAVDVGSPHVLGRHLTNIWDHRKPDAEVCFCHCYDEWRSGAEAMHAAWLRHIDWINHHLIGPPQATECYTREQLEAAGMIGIYARPE
jgi:hypothetical protein